ncbi:MAG: cytochrome c-type biogenesis protein CcmH [Acidobacteria bacterium]|nr:cytochrome c-type biogenesis protein CcmH [Acidobacteriota bacterium]
MAKFRWLSFICVVLLCVSPLLAQQAQTDAQKEAAVLFRVVMSPFCPGLTLADCPSPAAFEMRREIEARLEKGEPQDAIVQELVTKYGAQILADPSGTPIGSIVWGVPIVLSVLAATALALFLRRATNRSRQPDDDAHPARDVEDAAMKNRIDEELSDLD